MFDTEHHVPAGCSLTLASMMREHVSEARRAAVLRRQPEMRFSTEAVHVGREGARKECFCSPAAADSVRGGWDSENFLMERRVARVPGVTTNDANVCM